MRKSFLVLGLIFVIGGFMSCENGNSPTSGNETHTHTWGSWSVWSDWVETTAPTETEYGVETRTRTRTCTVSTCDAVDTQTETRQGNPPTGTVSSEHPYLNLDEAVPGWIIVRGVDVSDITHLIIPDEHNGVIIGSIAQTAFANWRLEEAGIFVELERVTIGRNVISIGTGAFDGHPTITHVVVLSNAQHLIDPDVGFGNPVIFLNEAGDEIPRP